VIKAPAEVCPICEGTGWKTVPSNPQARRVTRCECQLKARAESLLAAARIPKRYEHCTLASFKYEDQPFGVRVAYRAAQRFIEVYPVERVGLLFVGEAGVGKTHLAIGIAKALIEKGIDCIFYDYAELLKQIQESYNPTVEATELALLRPVFEAEVLVLDDLGSVRPTEWRWDTVRLMLNARYNNSRTTIITTNYADKPAAGAAEAGKEKEPEAHTAAKKATRKDTLGDRIGEPIRSRLHEMCKVVRIDAPDYRQGPNRVHGQWVS
jgi:DNA replication protein DnaC